MDIPVGGMTYYVLILIATAAALGNQIPIPDLAVGFGIGYLISQHLHITSF